MTTTHSENVEVHVLSHTSPASEISQIHTLLPRLKNPIDQNYAEPRYATMHGQVVGVAQLYRLSIHPTRWRLDLRVIPERRRQGIGTTLFNSCVQDPQLQDDIEVQVGVASEDHAELAFFRALGFETVMRTHRGTLSWIDIPEVSANEGPSIVTSLAQRPDLRQRVAEVHEEIYRTQHSWSPVGTISQQFRDSIFLDPDELVPEAQFLALLGDRIVGISSLRAPFSIASPDFGWIGVTSGVSDADAQLIHGQLVAACFDFARRNQVDMFVEIDEADPLTLAAFLAMNVSWEADWLNLVWRSRSSSS